jgi:hypothetical protein
MKRQWKIHRKVQEYPDGQSRWDRAYLVVLEIARSIEGDQMQTSLEVQHASSNLCESVDPTPSTSSNH